jgi:hypothetical protein
VKEEWGKELLYWTSRLADWQIAHCETSGRGRERERRKIDKGTEWGREIEDKGLACRAYHGCMHAGKGRNFRGFFFLFLFLGKE